VTRTGDTISIMSDIRTKTSSFGGATVAYFTPSQAETNPPFKVANVHLSFEEALKLHLSLGQLLGKLNGYNRATSAGKNAGAVLRVYFDIHRVVVAEQALRSRKSSSTTFPQDSEQVDGQE